MIQQLHGSKVYMEGPKRRSKPVGSLMYAVQLLQQASTKEQPWQVFGYNVTSVFYKYFSFHGKHNAENLLKAALNDLVQRAVATIEEELQEHNYALGGRRYRGTKDKLKRLNMTWIPLDEQDVPWEDERPWEKLADLPDVDFTPASSLVLRSVGIDENGGGDPN